MVRCILFVLALAPGLAAGITAEELRELAGLSANAAREKAGRVNDGDLSGLLPEKRPEEAPRPRSRPVSQKYSSVGAGEEASAAQPPTTKRLSEAQRAAVKPKEAKPYEYIPPPRGGFDTESPIFTYAIKVNDSPEFGISTGTWLDAEVVRDVNNAEPGPVEIRVTNAVPGKYRLMPAGTALFASASYNAGTRRLELVVSRGVTPTGLEFDLRARVYDLREVSGLSGVIKERKVIEGGVGRGLVAVGRAVVATAAGTSAVGAGLDAAAGTMLDDGDRKANERLRVGSIIYVPRQRVRVFVLSSL